jgi:multidrug resistance protein
VSVPLGAMSDRIGRKAPMVGGLAALAASSVVFALADRLEWLFFARLIQGAADAVTWVVGMALVADLFKPAERGRVLGFVMSASNFGFMIGPTLGGWLYETAGPRVPFLALGAVTSLAVLAFLAVRLPLPAPQNDTERVGLFRLLRVPAVAACAVAVLAGSGTLAMLEPVLSLHLADAMQMSPARVGLVFGIAAVASTALHPLFGLLADRFGARRMMMIGLCAAGLVLPLLGSAWNSETAATFYALQAVSVSLVVTPSLAYMAEASSRAGVAAFGVGYGVYNVAWSAGLLAGPSAGGVLYERMGFAALMWFWAAIPLLVVVRLAWTRSAPDALRPI